MMPLGSIMLKMTTVREMSKVLELQRSKEVQKVRTVAFASAAHEFRNPLSGIIQSLELLKQNDAIDTTIGMKPFKIAYGCSNLMLSLSNDILDFAQFEAKKLILNVDQRVNFI
jgi:signal transduction histidine kinase